MQDHIEVRRPWRPNDIFFISQERRNISRDENLHMLFEVKAPHGACVVILNSRLHESNGYLGW